MKICIIPARGGSKRIPRKNIKLFRGKPLIEWTIETAIASDLFDRIIISTEDSEIKDVALSAGAEVPFMRPLSLADDFTTTREVIIHALQELFDIKKLPEWTCCIYPSTPLLRVEDLIESFNTLEYNKLDFVFAAKYYDHPIEKAFFVSQDGELKRFFFEKKYDRTQDLIQALHDAGQFYWGKTNAFVENKDVISENSRPFILPNYLVYDLDTIEDWKRLEITAKIIEESNNHDCN